MRSSEVDRFFAARRDLARPKGTKWIETYAPDHGMRVRRDAKANGYFIVEIVAEKAPPRAAVGPAPENAWGTKPQPLVV